jgi:hypothetical protein
MRRKLAAMATVVGVALAVASPSLGDGGWGAGKNCPEPDVCAAQHAH